MNRKAESVPAGPSADGWDTGSNEDFYRYYEQQSLSPQTMARFRSTCDTLLRLFEQAGVRRRLDVLDVGCGAGAQSRLWLEHGHGYWGVDINEPLIALARRRTGEQGSPVRFDVGSATALPCSDATVDIVMMPELLEHVVDWRACIDEAVRVLRPGGMLYITTSSKLCPRQQEFTLPAYSWYPAVLKRHFERRAVTDWPAIVKHAKYPAVNWFSYYGLRGYLEPRGFACLDRFDLMDTGGKGTATRALLGVLRALPPMRFFGHMATPYTLLVGRKL